MIFSSYSFKDNCKMMKNILLPVLLAGSFYAQATFVPVGLTGFNNDAIANGVGNASASTTLAVDQSDWDLVAPDFKAIASNAAPTAALPANGLINSAQTPGLTYQLNSYSTNNALILSTINVPSTLTFTTACNGDVYVLGFTGNGSTTADIKVTFIDNSFQVFSGVSFSDWYGGTGFAIQGIGRVQRLTNVLEAPTGDPRMYEQKLSLSAANLSKGIASITVTKTNATGVLNIMAVTVCQAPVVSTHPVNKTVCKSWNTFFQAAASNVAAYRWQVNTGAGFVDITNNATYSGASSAMLNITQTPASFNNYQFRCSMRSTCGAVVYTNPAALVVIPDIAVTSLPATADMCSGGYAKVSIGHNGVGINYQWQVKTQLTGTYVNIANDFTYVGANTPSLEINGAPDSLKNAVLRCVVTGDCNSVTSADIPVNMSISAYVSQDPADMNILPYDDAYFEVKLGGSNEYLLYWQASTNGVDYVNINDNSLYAGTKGIRVVVKGAQPSLDGIKFRCIMKSTNPVCNSLRDTSEAATLHIDFPNNVKEQPKDAYGITLYPNPIADNDLYIAVPAAYAGDDAEILITDLQGRKVYSLYTVLAPTNNVKLPQTLQPGTYLLQIKGKTISSSHRFSKQ
jgi:hypothetical protein